jgi:hypothetical protein
MRTSRQATALCHATWGNALRWHKNRLLKRGRDNFSHQDLVTYHLKRGAEMEARRAEDEAVRLELDQLTARIEALKLELRSKRAKLGWAKSHLAKPHEGKQTISLDPVQLTALRNFLLVNPGASLEQVFFMRRCF